MGFWKYRAYDADYTNHEGVLVGPDANEPGALTTISLQLRQLGLQILAVEQITTTEYQREHHLQQLRGRFITQPAQFRPANTRKVQPSIRTRAWHLIRTLWRR